MKDEEVLAVSPWGAILGSASFVITSCYCREFQTGFHWNVVGYSNAQVIWSVWQGRQLAPSCLTIPKLDLCTSGERMGHLWGREAEGRVHARGRRGSWLLRFSNPVSYHSQSPSQQHEPVQPFLFIQFVLGSLTACKVFTKYQMCVPSLTAALPHAYLLFVLKF